MGHLGCGATYLTMSPILLLGGPRRHRPLLLLLLVLLPNHDAAFEHSFDDSDELF